MLSLRIRLIFAARYVGLLLGLLLTGGTALGHRPFDHSIHAVLFADELEVAVTLGSDAARLVLESSQADASGALGGMGAKSLPTTSAAHLCEIVSSAGALPATTLRVMGDGLEYTFVVRYPRPPSGPLTFQARYVNLAPTKLGLGTFVLTDEAGRQLGSGLISAANTAVELSLPAPEDTPNPSEAIVATETAAPPESSRVAAEPSTAPKPSFGAYLHLGIEHILKGYDHLLFLCALLVGCQRFKPMIAIITCFTLAHSVTLALAALDLVSISPRIVEPLIAASIVYVGIENFRGTVDWKKRCLITLGFGLIHGFGFAGVLRETGLAQSGAALATPLLAFNLGVEIGQLAVAAVFLPLLFLARRHPQFERYGPATVSACVVALGGFWLVQRLVS